MIRHLNNNSDLLRFATAGSVDDGKSTLIGRLLFESGGIYQDQLESMRKLSEKRGRADIDLSLLTDGLSSEREQGITIDVAYRYFSTEKRRFIIADVPGHEQYTRNMVTGASTADAILILVDATKGMTIQSKRHLYLSSLLQIPHIIVLINKMDAVAYEEGAFKRIQESIEKFSQSLSIGDIQCIPISALRGDMVVKRGDRMLWHRGPSVLEYLEQLPVLKKGQSSFRFPVQLVLRPDSKFRGYAGRLEEGVIQEGDEVMVLPSKKKARIREIFSGLQRSRFGKQGESITLTLEKELDVGRGDVIVSPHDTSVISHSFNARVCWMGDEPLQKGARYILKHETKTVQATMGEIQYRLNLDSSEHEQADELHLNEIGSVSIKTHESLVIREFSSNRSAGSFIIIDKATNATVGAGII
ncbi:MAG: GTP-binding protein [Patescibacteria group bacterium]